MDFQIAYWHWLVLGMVLIISEIFIPSFTVVWFGLAAILIAGTLLIFPGVAVAWQLFFWAVGSCAMTLAWFMFIKPRMVDRTQAGISREALLGQTGQVIVAPVDGRDGVMRFSVPMLGSDEWPFFCTAPVAVGDRVVVKEISGNTLIVENMAAP